MDGAATALAPLDSVALAAAPVDVDVAAAVAVDVAETPGWRNEALSSGSPLNFAGRRLSGAHRPLAHGLLAQHPMNGGRLNLHVYHISMLLASSQSCRGRSVYVSAEKEDARRLAAGQRPFVAAVQGFVVQQPINSVALFWQM